MPKGKYQRKMRSLSDRFWSKVDKRDPELCWEWQASLTAAGYGQMSAGKLGEQPIYAHRVSWKIHNGLVPDGLFVCHKCDNQRCVNPGHLFLGTQAENMADCASKGRARGTPKPGESNPAAKLTAYQVQEIRKATGLHREIAAIFGISKSYVSNLKRGEKWAHTYNGGET